MPFWFWYILIKIWKFNISKHVPLDFHDISSEVPPNIVEDTLKRSSVLFYSFVMHRAAFSKKRVENRKNRPSWVGYAAGLFKSISIARHHCSWERHAEKIWIFHTAPTSHLVFVYRILQNQCLRAFLDWMRPCRELNVVSVTVTLTKDWLQDQGSREKALSWSGGHPAFGEWTLFVKHIVVIS